MRPHGPGRLGTSMKVVLALVLGAFVFVASARFFAPETSDSVVEPARSSRLARPLAASSSALDAASSADPLEAPLRLEVETVHNPFGQLNLNPPAPAMLAASGPNKPKVAKPKSADKAPAMAAPAPPPAPVAPPLPFVAVGSIHGQEVTSGQSVAFLQQQDKLLIVRQGEAIGQLYRVESITPDRIEFTYLPLAQRQSLRISQ